MFVKSINFTRKLQTMIRSTKKTHKPADALDWDEAMKLIDRLYKDERYRDSMLIASGCFLGLRISDIRLLTWGEVCGNTEILSLKEKKTGKTRSLKLNRHFQDHAKDCREMLDNPSDEQLIFNSYAFSGRKPISRQRVAQILNEIKKTYNVKTAKVFSSHSLRKTFGRRVWQTECAKNRGDQALLLLCDVFGHSNTNITKRYLGIRQDEILSVYDSLEA